MEKRYGKYKDSGIAWISEIPEHWEATNFRYFINILTDYTANGSFGDLSKNVEYIGHRSYARLIRLTDLREDLNNENGVWVNEKAYNYLSKSSLYGGELLLANVGAYSGYSCIMPKVDYPTTLAPNMFLIKQYKKDLNTKYLWYLLSSKMFFNYLQIVALSSAQPKLNKENIRQTPIIIPPIIEQEQIAKYLDWKCGEVDRIVEVRERQIKLLGELRTSVINRTVTCGLNPNAPLKDSGIDWIGQIPEHWEICRLKNACSLKGRIGWKGLRSEEFEQMSYAYLVTGQDFHSAIIDWTKCYQISKERYDEDPYIQLSNGDLLITKDGTIGKIAKVSNMNKPTCLNSGIFVMKQTKALFEQSYLYWLLESSLLKEFNNYTSTGTTILHLYQNFFENMPFIIPSLSEQQKIAEYLDKKTEEIDSTIDKFKVQIDKLKEYRQALIAEVVTGKIDIRSIEIPIPKSN